MQMQMIIRSAEAERGKDIKRAHGHIQWFREDLRIHIVWSCDFRPNCI